MQQETYEELGFPARSSYGKVYAELAYAAKKQSAGPSGVFRFGLV